MNTQYFETIKCFNNEIYNLLYHKKRISSTIGLNLNLEEYLYPPNNELLKCKVIYNQNEILDINYDIYKKREIKSLKLIFDDTIYYTTKSLNRDNINNLYLKKENCDDVIIIKNNLITDTSIANIAIYYDNQWLTPKKPLLYGTTRQRYIDNNFLKEKDISIEMLLKSKKIALLNAMIDFDIIQNITIEE